MRKASCLCIAHGTGGILARVKEVPQGRAISNFTKAWLPLTDTIIDEHVWLSDSLSFVSFYVPVLCN